MAGSGTRTTMVIGGCVVLLAAGASVPAAFLVRGRLAEQHLHQAATAFATADTVTMS